MRLRACRRPWTSLQECSVPFRPRRFTRGSAVKHMTRSLPVACCTMHDGDDGGLGQLEDKDHVKEHRAHDTTAMRDAP